MNKITLDEYKAISLEILKSIHKICEENNLVYFLDCGSLIGCIRHKGFIPWDDDIDLLMPRNDYEKFIKIYKDDGFTLFHHSIQKEYYYQYAKVSRDNTYINYFSVPDIPGLGVNVDIFIIDGMPDQLIKRRIHQDLLAFLSKYRALMVRLCKALPSFSFLFRWKWIVKLLNSLGAKYLFGETRYCGNITATTIRHKEIPKECFSSSIKGEFEGSMFCIPFGYDEYLKLMYGDYMKLPPENKRVPIHHFDAFTL